MDADQSQSVCMCTLFCNHGSLHASMHSIGPAMCKCCCFRTELVDTWHMKIAHVFTNGLLGL